MARPKRKGGDSPQLSFDFGDKFAYEDTSLYQQARRSTQDAHYTSRDVIDGIYKGLERLGVGGSDEATPIRTLEPSVGITPADSSRDTEEISENK